MSKALSEMKKAVSGLKEEIKTEVKAEVKKTAPPSKKPAPKKPNKGQSVVKGNLAKAKTNKTAEKLPAATTRIHDVGLAALAKTPAVQHATVETPVVTVNVNVTTSPELPSRPMRLEQVTAVVGVDNGPAPRGDFGVLPEKRYSQETKERRATSSRRPVDGFSQIGSGFTPIK